MLQCCRCHLYSATISLGLLLTTFQLNTSIEPCSIWCFYPWGLTIHLQLDFPRPYHGAMASPGDMVLVPVMQLRCLALKFGRIHDASISNFHNIRRGSMSENASDTTRWQFLPIKFRGSGNLVTKCDKPIDITGQNGKWLDDSVFVPKQYSVYLCIMSMING